MNFSVLSSFAGTPLWFCGAFGVVFVIIGLLLYRYASLRRPLKARALGSFSEEARHWQIPATALPEYSYSLKLFATFACIGLGVGSMLFAIVYGIVSVGPLWNIVCTFSYGTLSTSVWFLCCMAGASGGGYYAFRRLRRQALSLRDGGPRRHLRDYRSPFLRLIPVAWLVLICTLVFAFHRSYMPMNDCLNSDFFYRTPWQGWIVYPWLGVALVMALSIEVMLSRVASVHSPLIPTNIPGAAAIDDMFRAKIINAVQGIGFMQMMFFGGTFSTFVASDYFLLAEMPMFFALFVLALITIPSTGLGGRLTGWFWKRQPTS